MMRTSIAAAALATVGLLFVALPADGSRPPKKPERVKIEKALEGKFDCAIFQGVPCKRKIRVSTRNEKWAAAYIRPGQGRLGHIQPAEASLKRNNHRWKVHQIGNGGGCDVPSKVVNDLNLDCF